MKSRRRQGGWLSFLSGLALGLFVALLVYLQAHAPRSAQTQATTQEQPAETPTGTAGSPAVKKPRFDFYTILPEMEVKVPEWEVAKDARKSPETPARAAAYMLQVGSFQRYEDADRIKARLALIGVSADVQPVVINGKDTWHRVRVGPFQDLNKLQATRSRLAENHISFMLVRMKAGEEPGG